MDGQTLHLCRVGIGIGIGIGPEYVVGLRRDAVPQRTGARIAPAAAPSESPARRTCP
ncbi:hypothetical protein [Aquabacterium sp. OR-4]|uniref:hypothetical protein n=1 Tax=Aquabacterium sp. OR-4 TaxID=2978127 RepID=UPI0021B27006|nr:hypothetical protein [Aquabacterium sp. OR-4]MDT7834422.1 hypothetical protein [Aquabacterium sp. OR-4]